MIENEIVKALYTYVFGNRYLLAMGVLFVVAFITLAFRAGKVVLFMVMIPLISAFLIGSTFIEIPLWMSIVAWLFAGGILGMIVLSFVYQRA